jgi:hypothetical protein
MRPRGVQSRSSEAKIRAVTPQASDQGVKMTVPAYRPAERRNQALLFKPAAPFRGGDSYAAEDEGNAGQGRLLFERADDARGSGVYYPETLKTMCRAFDLAWKHVSSTFEDQEKARSILAVQILHHVDRGEHNVGRLATSATDDLLALTRASDRRYVRTRGTSTKGIARQSFATYRALREV